MTITIAISTTLNYSLKHSFEDYLEDIIVYGFFNWFVIKVYQFLLFIFIFICKERHKVIHKWTGQQKLGWKKYKKGVKPRGKQSPLRAIEKQWQRTSNYQSKSINAFFQFDSMVNLKRLLQIKIIGKQWINNESLEIIFSSSNSNQLGWVASILLGIQMHKKHCEGWPMSP